LEKKWCGVIWIRKGHNEGSEIIRGTMKRENNEVSTVYERKKKWKVMGHM